MTFEDVARFSQTWGLVLLVGMFAVCLAYALWLGNRDKFRRPARDPLDKEE